MRRTFMLAEILDADSGFVRRLTPVKSQCTLRYATASTAYLTVVDSHPVVPEVLPDGMRAAVWMVTLGDDNTVTKRRLLEGRIGNISGEGPQGTVTIPVTDDFEMLGTVLGWPKPSAAASAQTDEYARYSGPSETRALAAIAANATRLGLPWNVAATLGRGTAGTTELRMHPLADKILAALTADRLRLVIERNADTGLWDIDVREGNTLARPLTPRSGVLARWEWRKQRPTATRVVVGGAGEGAARAFHVVTDSALETALGVPLEVFDDSRMAEAGSDLTPYGVATLADRAAKAGIDATLRETSWFRFDAGSYDLGTKLLIQIGALEVDDVVTQIDITHDARTGFSAVPKVGFTTSDPQARLLEFVSGVASSVRSMESR